MSRIKTNLNATDRENRKAEVGRWKSLRRLP